MKVMEILFLGTACMQPTKDRNHSAILLVYKGENILFDCGEGTQRQLKIAGIKPGKITKVFISHWHGDHVLGLPGLLQTMGASQYTKKLEIYGPVGSKQYIDYMIKGFSSKGNIDFEVHEVKPGIACEYSDYYVECAELKHYGNTLGYSFIEKDRRRMNLQKIKKLGIPQGPLLGKLQQGKNIVYKGNKIKADDVTRVVKGKKITYVADTKYCSNAIKLADDSDLLISEAVYTEKLKDKAEEYRHLTAKEAGMIANQSNSKRLILTHFSQRYKTTQDIENEARDIFDNVTCAYDFMRIKL